MGGTFNNSQSAPIFNSTPSLGQSGSAFAPGSSPFAQNPTPVFPQTNNFSTPSSGFASLFSTSPSLASNNSPLGQTTVSFFSIVCLFPSSLISLSLPSEYGFLILVCLFFFCSLLVWQPTNQLSKLNHKVVLLVSIQLSKLNHKVVLLVSTQLSRLNHQVVLLISTQLSKLNHQVVLLVSTRLSKLNHQVVLLVSATLVKRKQVYVSQSNQITLNLIILEF